MHYKEVKGILSAKNGMNIYRGCQHGCIYCDSRSSCYQIHHDFEDIEVKSNAIELLDDALRRKRNKCVIATGSMSDPYIPLEKDLRYTRRALEVIDRRGFGLAILTKSDLVMRDMDLLKSINTKAKCTVQMTLTTADEALCRILEPGVCGTHRRFEVLERMRDEGIATVVWLGPILPYINDTEENVAQLMDYCLRAGVKGLVFFGIGMTLREGNREYFYTMLDRHFPGLKQRYQQRYGKAYQIPSDNSPHLSKLVRSLCAGHSVMCEPEQVFSWMHAFVDKTAEKQGELF